MESEKNIDTISDKPKPNNIVFKFKKPSVDFIKNVVIIVLVFGFLFLLVWFWLFPKYAQAAYNQGQTDLIFQINTQETIPILYAMENGPININNQTYSIQWRGMESICNELGAAQ